DPELVVAGPEVDERIPVGVERDAPLDDVASAEWRAEIGPVGGVDEVHRLVVGAEDDLDDAVLPLVDDGLTGPAEATPGRGLSADAGAPAHRLIGVGPGDRRAVGDRAGSVEGSGRVAPEHRDAPHRSPG